MGRPILAAPHHPQPWLWPDEGLHAAWLGHSTVLVKADGFLFITDPVLSTRVGVNLGVVTVGIKRLVHSALGAHEIPTPDLILLSHAHMDHFDLPSLRDLEHRRTAVVTATSTSDLLRVGRYGSVAEVRWGESCRVGPAVIRGLEVNHWGARMRSDTYRGYNGYLVEVGRFRIMFGGDTAFTYQFKRVRSGRKIDLAIMPIGAYDPWIRVHCSPEQAWTMANQAGAEFVLPVHHQTFLLGRESAKEPVERLLDAADPFPERVCIREIGQEFHLA
jgi:L-ascorbate metabolism protein UlaG (beta-lactamase superfamily)